MLERYECADAIRAGLSELPKRQRDLLGLLLVEPPLPYAEISRQLGVPVGSIRADAGPWTPAAVPLLGHPPPNGR